MKRISRGKHAALLLCFALLLTLIFSAVPVHGAPKVPDPPVDSWVLDEADVISSDTEQKINLHMDYLCQQTGAQIATVTINFAGAEMEDYAYTLFNHWGIGSKTENNGVLLLYSIGDQDYYMLQGKGLERVLTSGTLQNIIDYETEPQFAKGDYDTCAAVTFVAVYNQLAQHYGLNELSSIDDQAGGSLSGGTTPDYDNDFIYDSDYDYGGHVSSGSFFDFLPFLFFLIVVIILINTAGKASKNPRSYTGGTRYRTARTYTRPLIWHNLGTRRLPRRPAPPRPGGIHQGPSRRPASPPPGSFGGPHPGGTFHSRPGGSFHSRPSRPSGGSSFGGGGFSGGSRGGFSGGGRSFGGGGSRGGGAGRGR